MLKPQHWTKRIEQPLLRAVYSNEIILYIETGAPHLQLLDEIDTRVADHAWETALIGSYCLLHIQTEGLSHDLEHPPIGFSHHVYVEDHGGTMRTTYQVDGRSIVFLKKDASMAVLGGHGVEYLKGSTVAGSKHHYRHHQHSQTSASQQSSITTKASDLKRKEKYLFQNISSQVDSE